MGRFGILLVITLVGLFSNAEIKLNSQELKATSNSIKESVFRGSSPYLKFEDEDSSVTLYGNGKTLQNIYNKERNSETGIYDFSEVNATRINYLRNHKFGREFVSIAFSNSGKIKEYVSDCSGNGECVTVSRKQCENLERVSPKETYERNIEASKCSNMMSAFLGVSPEEKEKIKNHIKEADFALLGKSNRNQGVFGKSKAIANYSIGTKESKEMSIQLNESVNQFPEHLTRLVTTCGRWMSDEMRDARVRKSSNSITTKSQGNSSSEEKSESNTK